MSVQSLERAFSILDTIGRHPDGIGVTAIAAEIGLHKSTVSRLLGTLETLGAVERLPNYDGFRIGSTIFDLAQKVDPRHQLINLARPYLEELASLTEESASLEVPDGRAVLYLDQVQTNHAIRVHSWVGIRYPVHTITSGAMFMSNWSDRTLKRYFENRVSQAGENSLATLSSAKESIQRFEEDGYVFVSDGFEVGLTGISAPITNRDDEIVAGINICGPTFRFPAEGQFDTIVARLIKATTAISETLGSMPHEENWEVEEIEPSPLADLLPQP